MELEDQMELVLLYHHVSKCRHSVRPTDVAPIPTRASATMYKLNVQADDRVECGHAYVTLYDSLEVMGSELREELSRVQKGGKLFYAVKEEELLKDFICL